MFISSFHTTLFVAICNILNHSSLHRLDISKLIKLFSKLITSQFRKTKSSPWHLWIHMGKQMANGCFHFNFYNLFWYKVPFFLIVYFPTMNAFSFIYYFTVKHWTFLCYRLRDSVSVSSVFTELDSCDSVDKNLSDN